MMYIFNPKIVSSIFRTAFKNKVCSYVTSRNILRINFNASCTDTGNYNFKTSRIFLPSTRFSRSFVQKKKHTINDTKHLEVNPDTDEKEIVYTGPLRQSVTFIKFLSFITSVCGISLQPFIFMKAVAQTSAPSATIPLAVVIAVISVSTPGLLHLLIRKYALSIVYYPNHDKYVVTVYKFFGTKRKIEFTPSDVKIPVSMELFSTCYIKGVPIFVDEADFESEYHYRRIMGYDKPIEMVCAQAVDTKKDKTSEESNSQN